MSNEQGQADRSSEEAWRVLGEIREALEQVLPPGWVRPSDETPRLLSAEVDTLVAAIRSMAKVIPPDALTDRIV